MLKQGIYEHIVNNQVEKEISKAENFGLVCKKQPVDNAESPKILADYLAKVICQKLEDTEAQQDRVNIINRILINAGLMDDTQIVDSTDLLYEVMSHQKYIHRHRAKPRQSALFQDSE